jgi:hypothetical protein
MKCYLITAGFLLLTASVTPAAAQAPAIILHDLPVKSNEIKNSFCTVGNSLVTVPLKGGIYELVFKTWLIKPDTNLQILNYDICMADTSLLLAVKKDNVMLIAKGKNNPLQYISKTYCSIPAGFCQLTSVGLDSFFVWHFNKQYSTIYFYGGTNSLQTLLRTKDTITTYYPLNATTVLFAIGPTLFSLSPQKKPVALKNFPADIDGISQDDNGQLIISTFKGIYAVSTASKQIILMTDEFHGPMKFSLKTLFVLDRSRNKIVQLNL